MHTPARRTADDALVRQRDWDQIWQGDRAASRATGQPNPHLVQEVSDLPPGTALDAGCGAGRVQWVQADVSAWVPDAQHDLVTTHYAHPAMPQLEFYDRIAAWVAPGGTLLIVGHLHQDASEGDGHGHAHGHGGAEPPASASVTAAAISASWRQRQQRHQRGRQIRTAPSTADVSRAAPDAGTPRVVRRPGR